MNEIVVLNTTDSMDLAQSIASALVRAREAACVNIIPGIRSVYIWEGKECNEGEFLLVIKSSVEQFESIRSRIRKMHSYRTPEIIALQITDGDPDYIAWLRASILRDPEEESILSPKPQKQPNGR
jgi:periplasmic divalent cation tolerance protein